MLKTIQDLISLDLKKLIVVGVIDSIITNEEMEAKASVSKKMGFFKKHQVSKTIVKKFKCLAKRCKRSYERKKFLWKHIQLHTKNPCDFSGCGKYFMDKVRLEHHK